MTPWAADATVTAWQGWLPAVLGAVFTALLAAAGSVLVKRMGRRLDEATVVRTEAETRKTVAEAEATQVATARGLVAEIRELMVDQRRAYEGQLETVRNQHQGDIKAMTDRLGHIEQAFTMHREWDRRATAVLRRTDSRFPDPPPVSFE